MQWIKMSVTTDNKGLLDLPKILEKRGITGFVVVDPTELKEILDSPNKTWDYEEESVFELLDTQPEITFYLESEENLSKIEKDIVAYHEKENTSYAIDIEYVRESDWADKWKENYHAMKIGNMTIIPIWEKENSGSKNKESIDIYLNPGHIFGTGQHESTQLVLSIMQEVELENKTVADIGCGSGILSIGASKLGASHIFMTEIEDNASDIIHENMLLNKVDTYELCSTDIIKDEKLQRYMKAQKIDVFLVNIVADVIIELLPILASMLEKDGSMVLSGILDYRTNEVLDVVKEYFETYQIRKEKDWVAMLVSGKKG